MRRTHACLVAVLRLAAMCVSALVLATTLASTLVPALAAEEIVIRVPITGMIDMGLSPFVRRAFDEAQERGARAVLFEINTLGGRLDAMLEIRDAIVEARVPTLAFVHPRAISAGALIAIACDSLYMAPGSTIGAATPVEGDTGVKASEKVVSFSRSEFRSTAERKGRDPDLAAAMVDESIEIEGVVKEGELLTLTGSRAVELGFATALVESQDAVLRRSGLSGAVVRTLSPNWGENFIRFLNHPVVAAVLMAIIFFGIIAEVQTAGWGVPGTAALVSLLLFLGGRYVVGLVGFEELLLLLVGFALLVVEALFIPGFGIAGIVGILCLVGSLVLALLGHVPTTTDLVGALYTIGFALVAAIAGALVLFRYVERIPAWRRVTLTATQRPEEGYVAHPMDSGLVGKIGVAATDLHPSGAMVIDGKRYDVVCDAGFVMRGASVRVLKHEGYRIVVEEIAEGVRPQT
ncbi:MAG TPA: NfeD family protein [Candidatus Krumholzibacteria bacterium]|nr:NfeD family protein [Candidatus Krumholzibacteria bacterium]